jgi:hypothetical protein
MTYVGLDLHKRYITACVLDASGSVAAEERRLMPGLPALTSWLARLPAPVIGVLEARFIGPGSSANSARRATPCKSRIRIR